MAFETQPPSPSTFTARDIALRFHSWFLAHRVQLKKWWVILILAVDIVLILTILVSLFSYFAQNGRYERLMLGMAKGIEPAPILREQKAQALVIQPGVVLAHDEVQDIVALVANTNADWLNRLQYHFEVDGQSTDSTSAVLLPNQTRYLASLNQSLEVNSATATLVIEKNKWSRLVDRTRFTETSFLAENIVFEPAAVAPNTGRTFARVSADVVNNSLYGYWAVDVPVIVLDQGAPVAVQFLTLRAFRPGERRTISAQWFDRLPSQATASIQPTVDILDEENYMNE
jgi:hypothetical protein